MASDAAPSGMARRRIPCHIVAGALGTGKTTAILNFLRRRAGHETTGVVVNDFGPLGIDSETLKQESGADRVDVVNVQGGCLCCSSTGQALDAVLALVNKPGLDRIIIEPSGMALPTSFLRGLQTFEGRDRLDIRPVIVMTDPTRCLKALNFGVPYFEQLMASADILIANRGDVTPPQTMEAFLRKVATYTPVGGVIFAARFGHIPDDVFLMETPNAAARKIPDEREIHSALRVVTGGWTWPPETVFRLNALQAYVRHMTTDLDIERFKGHFLTDQGPWALEIASGTFHSRPIATIDHSKAEWISGEKMSPTDVVRQLTRCT